MFTTWYKKGKLSWPLKTNGKGPGPLHLALWHVTNHWAKPAHPFYAIFNRFIQRPALRFSLQKYIVQFWWNFSILFVFFLITLCCLHWFDCSWKHKSHLGCTRMGIRCKTAKLKHGELPAVATPCVLVHYLTLTRYISLWVLPELELKLQNKNLLASSIFSLQSEFLTFLKYLKFSSISAIGHQSLCPISPSFEQTGCIMTSIVLKTNGILVHEHGLSNLFVICKQ